MKENLLTTGSPLRLSRAIPLLVALVALGGAARAETWNLVPGELTVTALTGRVFVVTHSYPWESNSLVAVSGKGAVVFVDTPYTSEATALLLDWVVARFRPVSVEAVITGYHVDNAGGVALLRSRGIPVAGSSLTASLIREKGRQTLQTLMGWLAAPDMKKYRDAYARAELAQPDRLFDPAAPYSLTRGDLSLEVYYPGESHAADNVVAYLRGESILFGSCILKAASAANLGFTGDANLALWPEAVKKVRVRYGNASIVIPHHGPWGGSEIFDHTLALLE